MPIDRRVRFTKLCLKESLIKLLKQKPISRITIKALCEDADINRATYYAHYTDQYDQLKQIEAEFISGVVGMLKDLSYEDGEAGLLNIIGGILQYVEENRELCLVLLGENGNLDFQDNITRVLRELIVRTWREKKAMDESTAGYCFTYVACGSIGMVRAWLFGEAPQVSRAQLARMILLLNNGGVQTFLK